MQIVVGYHFFKKKPQKWVNTFEESQNSIPKLLYEAQIYGYSMAQLTFPLNSYELLCFQLERIADEIAAKGITQAQISKQTIQHACIITYTAPRSTSKKVQK